MLFLLLPACHDDSLGQHQPAVDQASWEVPEGALLPYLTPPTRSISRRPAGLQRRPWCQLSRLPASCYCSPKNSLFVCSSTPCGKLSQPTKQQVVVQRCLALPRCSYVPQLAIVNSKTLQILDLVTISARDTCAYFRVAFFFNTLINYLVLWGCNLCQFYSYDIVMAKCFLSSP